MHWPARSHLGRLRWTLAALAGSAVLLLAAGCGQMSLSSSWRDEPVRVDGAPAEWTQNLFAFKDSGLAAGCYNDAQYLYICVVADNEMRERQFITQGFTLWVDPDGGETKTWGIRCPLGLGRVHPDRPTGPPTTGESAPSAAGRCVHPDALRA